MVSLGWTRIYVNQEKRSRHQDGPGKGRGVGVGGEVGWGWGCSFDSYRAKARSMFPELPELCLAITILNTQLVGQKCHLNMWYYQSNDHRK